MSKEEFLDLVWRLEELLMHRDYLQSQIGKCEGRCDEEDEGLCPACCEAFEKVRAEDDRLIENGELTEVMKKLKQACDEDKSGEYQRLLNQFREGKVFH
jgi:hypothetical protein